METTSFARGITLRSFFACLTCLLLAGIYTQVTEVILATFEAPAEQVLPITAMGVLLPLLLLGGLLYKLGRIRILNKAELLCIAFAMLMAVPMMTQGMWHRFFGLLAATPRTASFNYIDAMSDKLWPHGPNLLPGLAENTVTITGGKAVWEAVEYEKGRTATLPRLVNATGTETKTLKFVLPLTQPNGARINPAEPYLVSILARTADMAPDSMVYCRALEDAAENGVELLAVGKAEEKTFIHQTGFVRLGAYGVSFSRDSKTSITLEFCLRGRGSVHFADPRFFTVSAIENGYKGRRVILQSEWDALQETQRDPNLVVRPDSLWSVAGAKFLVEGYIPLRDWSLPIIAWGSFIGLLLAGLLAINIIMRRQWAENERFPFPNAQIPQSLIGLDEPGEGGAMASIWTNRTMWAGIAVALIYGGLKAWAKYNPAVPSPIIDVPLKPFFMAPGWGAMWDTSFTVSLFIVSIAVFFDLNVLMSLVVGYWLYRLTLLVKGANGIGANPDYPWRYEQAIGAYIGYTAAVLFFTRKYLWRTLKNAFTGKERDEQDVLSSRGALVLLALSVAGIVLWAQWLEATVSSILIFFAFLLVIGFVASKLRAECGLAGGYFTPYNAMLFVAACGGMTAFGANSMLIALILSGFLTVTVFFFIPGTQLELIQLGRGIRLHPRHVIYSCLLGLFGGLVIGGWVFLSNAYALGGDAIPYQWSFNQNWFFSSYKVSLVTATAQMNSPDAAAGTDYGVYAMLGSGGLVMVITMLRQLFSGFWFHPVGIILGTSHLLSDFGWGSILAALIIRFFVLKLGGAMAVRNQLKPFFIGTFLGCMAVVMIFHAVAMYLKSTGATQIFGVLP